MSKQKSYKLFGEKSMQRSHENNFFHQENLSQAEKNLS